MFERNDNPRPVCMADIAQMVATYYHVGLSDLRCRNRRHSVVRPRHVAFYLCRVHACRSYEEIGAYFGRDHATVMHGVSLVERQIAEPESLLGMQAKYLREELRKPKPVEAVA